MRFGFLITARCNAACTHCTTSCGPNESTALSQEKLISLMDEAAAIWRQRRFPGEALTFSISGGEPFLDFAQLNAVVAHGRDLGAVMSCVTNGFWAANDARAREKLLALKHAGLDGVAVSTSRFHQQFVKRERVDRALRVAHDLGLHTTLKCAITSGDQDIERWARQRQVDRLEVFPVVPYLRDGAGLPERDYIRQRGLPEGPCPYPTITVREDGRAYTCCMPGGFTPLLRLGNVHESPLEHVYRKFYLSGPQQVLRHRGPAHFARALIAQGHGERLRESYESVCDLCAHIAADPVMSAIAEGVASDFAREQSRKVLQEIRSIRAVSNRESAQNEGERHEQTDNPQSPDRGIHSRLASAESGG